MTLPDSIKPPSDASEALDLLVDSLLTQIREAPVSVDDLLARINANPPEHLAAVTDYMRGVGFLDGNQLNHPALYHLLKIDLRTGLGTRVLLTERGGRFVLHYFPGYASETPLKQFLMQELTSYPIIQINVKGSKRRVIHARENRVGQMLRLLYEVRWGYERTHRTKLDVRTRQLTIGEFLKLPTDVVERCPEIYQMLDRYGFSQETGLDRR